MMRRRTLAWALAGLGTAAHTATHAQVQDIQDAINKAGRQRMLSQRMWKAYAALGLGVMPLRAAEVLSQSMAMFDRQLVELKVFAPNADIRATYQALDEAWAPYKAMLLGEQPTRARAPQLALLAGRVLPLAHQGTTQLESVSGKPAGKLVNLAGRQRMLSQRMAALYMTAVWGVRSEGTAPALELALQEFRQAHVVLKGAPEATPTILEQLNLAEAQFLFFSTSLRKLSPDLPEKAAATEVFTTSERILQVMDKVTGLYAAHPVA